MSVGLSSNSLWDCFEKKNCRFLYVLRLNSVSIKLYKKHVVYLLMERVGAFVKKKKKTSNKIQMPKIVLVTFTTTHTVSKKHKIFFIKYTKFVKQNCITNCKRSSLTKLPHSHRISYTTKQKNSTKPKEKR